MLYCVINHNLCFSLGWLINYKAKGVSYVPQNFGFMDLESFTPVQKSITSNGSTLSVLWVGRYLQMEIRKVYRLDISSLYFQVSTTIKNTGDATVSSLYCKFVLR